MTSRGPFEVPFLLYHRIDNMGINPTDLGSDFIASGMRLITQQSSDALLKKAKQTEDQCPLENWDPSLGPQEPSEDCQ